MLDVNMLDKYASLWVYGVLGNGQKIYDVIVEIRQSPYPLHLQVKAKSLVELETILSGYFKTFISSRKSVFSYRGNTVYRFNVRANIIVDCLAWLR